MGTDVVCQFQPDNVSTAITTCIGSGVNCPHLNYPKKTVSSTSGLTYSDMAGNYLLSRWRKLGGGTYRLSLKPTSGRAGTEVYLSYSSRCPGASQAYFKLVSQETGLSPSSGNLLQSAWGDSLRIPMGSYAYQSDSDLPIGKWTVLVQCQLGAQSVAEYTHETLTVTGPAANLRVSTGLVRTGDIVRISSPTPCPLGSDKTQVYLQHNMWPSSFTYPVDPSTGIWRGKFTFTDDHSYDVTSVSAVCTKPNAADGYPRSTMEYRTLDIQVLR